MEPYRGVINERGVIRESIWGDHPPVIDHPPVRLHSDVRMCFADPIHVSVDP